MHTLHALEKTSWPQHHGCGQVTGAKIESGRSPNDRLCSIILSTCNPPTSPFDQLSWWSVEQVTLPSRNELVVFLFIISQTRCYWVQGQGDRPSLMLKVSHLKIWLRMIVLAKRACPSKGRIWMENDCGAMRRCAQILMLIWQSVHELPEGGLEAT